MIELQQRFTTDSKATTPRLHITNRGSGDSAATSGQEPLLAVGSHGPLRAPEQNDRDAIFNFTPPETFMSNFPPDTYSQAERALIGMQYRMDRSYWSREEAKENVRRPGMNRQQQAQAETRYEALKVAHALHRGAYTKSWPGTQPAPFEPQRDGEHGPLPDAKIYQFRNANEWLLEKRDIRRAHDMALHDRLIYINAHVDPITPDNLAPFFDEPLEQLLAGLNALRERGEAVLLEDVRHILPRNIQTLTNISHISHDPLLDIYSGLRDQWTHINVLQQYTRIQTVAGALAYFTTLAQRYPKNPNGSA